MTTMDAALRGDSNTLADLARRYDGPVDLAAVGVLHLLMESADLVHTGHGPLLIIPTTIALIDEINDVLAPLENDEDNADLEPDDPPEDDDPKEWNGDEFELEPDGEDGHDAEEDRGL